MSLSKFSRWDALPWADAYTAYTAVVYAVALKRVVRVVTLLRPGESGITPKLLFSTDPTMDTATVVRLYRARFAMEFPFRDGKQFAGLNDGQSRQPETLHFHRNMTLHSSSMARASPLINGRRETPYLQRILR